MVAVYCAPVQPAPPTAFGLPAPSSQAPLGGVCHQRKNTGEKRKTRILSSLSEMLYILFFMLRFGVSGLVAGVVGLKMPLKPT